MSIAADADLVPARAAARRLATELGFSRTDATLIATAVSEIARNIVVHAGRGELVMRALVEQQRYGLLVIARDQGPGIASVDLAMLTGVGTGLGLGLPGAKRLMDEFSIESEPNSGTTVVMKKWRQRDELERLRERRRRERVKDA